MLADNTVADPQAEAGSFPDTLGGEEGFENPADKVLLDARTVVGYRDHHVAALPRG